MIVSRLKIKLMKGELNAVQKFLYGIKSNI